MKRGNVVFWFVGAAMLVAGLAFFALAIMMSGCAAQTVVDATSPRETGAVCMAGSDLTESSQYVEVRIAFDGVLEATGSVADDLEVLVNGSAPDARTMVLEASVDGDEVVVRLVPTVAADGSSSSVYYALYNGLVSVGARSADGGLPHVKAVGAQSNAVLDEPVSCTVPSGVEIGSVEAVAADAATGTAASVSFEVLQFAQIRDCTWFSFGDGFPLVMMHNHEFLRDTPQTCAKRLADTVASATDGALEAEAEGSQVTVRAPGVADGTVLSANIVEGMGVDPALDAKDDSV